MHDVLNLGDEDEISFDEKKKEEVVKKQESKDDMRRQLEKKLGIVQVRKPRWRYFWKSMPDLPGPTATTPERTTAPTRAP